MGKPDTLRYLNKNSKMNILNLIDDTFNFLESVEFNNCGFDKFLKSISLDNKELKDTFIYTDPPYLGTSDNYSNSFTEENSFDLFECLQDKGTNYAMSEFDHPFILEQAKERNLNVIIIGERQNLKNRRTEILITNYETIPTLF